MEFSGIVYEIIFRSEDTGYTVAILDTDDMPVTIVGELPQVKEGEHISVVGEIVFHKIYGEQVKVKEYRIVPPQTEKGIVKYLSSGIISGIGEKIAKKIVEYFGKDALDIIHYSPNRLKEVPGIGKKTLAKIVNSLESEREVRETMIYLQGFDISPRMCMRIFREYGEETVKIVSGNPYRLADEIRGVGFQKADEIAKAIGVPATSEYRIKSAVLFSLREDSSKGGHTYSPKSKLIEDVHSMIDVERELIEQGIMELQKENRVFIERLDGDMAVYSMAYYNCEAGTAKKLIRIALDDKDEIEIDFDSKIAEMEKNKEVKFADKQKEAVKEAISSGVMVITGGPGTGKTTTINAIIDIFEEAGKEVILAAPTGRAAKRMTEATGREAKTIHRLLEYSYMDEQKGMFFGKNEENLLEADLIIVDEVSMVDIMLINSLLSAVNSRSRLILVGDVDQLPSVGAGNVLKDIIKSGTIDVVMLDEIFRQAKESMIVLNAHKINRGEAPLVNVKGKDFFFIFEENPVKVKQIILDLVRTRLPNYKQYDSFTDIQVLACGRKGDVGVNALNEMLQQGLNPSRGPHTEKRIGSDVFRVGDKVMQTKNDYNTEWKIREDGITVDSGKGIYNGDMGFIIDVDNDENELTVLFDDDKEVTYPYAKLDELSLSYANTVHKSQGSEFPVVIMPMVPWPPMLLSRNLLYTGITRARELVVLVGNPYYMELMIRNDKVSERYSRLAERLSVINRFRRDEHDEEIIEIFPEFEDDF